MKRLLIPTIISFLCIINPVISQVVLDSLMSNYSPQQIDSIYNAEGIPNFVGQSNYAVDVFKVIYETHDANGDPTTASGAIFLPVNAPCGVPIISYQHGTLANQSGLPSRLGGESIIGTVAASHGYAVFMPDYIGMGDGPGFHPYCHAQTEANAVLDIIRSGKSFCNANGYELNEQVFLMGYSQGGHATMAAIREIELNYSSEFNIVASAPMAGPYDISGVQRELFEKDSAYSQPGYLPYVIMGYNEVYNLYDSLQEVFTAPYDSIIEMLFDGNNSMGTINGYLPSIPKDMLDSAYFSNFLADSLHPFKIALKENDLYDWIPQTHIKIAHCAGDNVVPFSNAQIAFDAFVAAGADSVELINNGNMDHGPCGELSIIGAKLFFDTKASFCSTPSSINEQQESEILVFPNPSLGHFLVSFSNKEIMSFRITDVFGKEILPQTEIMYQEVELNLTEKGNGVYFLIVNYKEGNVTAKKLFVN